jgi:MFS family permease
MRHPRNWYILLAIAFLQGLVFYAPIATRYRLDNGIDLGQLFAIESISFVLTILLELPFGLLADRIGCRRVILLGNAVFALSKLVFAGAEGFGLFLAERVLLALSLAALSGASESFLSASIGGEGAERRFGLWGAAGTAGLLLASLVSPLLYGVSLRFAAYATILPYALAALLSLFLVDAGPAREKGAAPGRELRSALGRLLADAPLLRFLLAMTLVQEFSQVAVVFLSPLQYERAGIPRPLYGALFAGLQVAALASGLSGRLAKALGRRASLLALAATACAAGALLALSADPWLSVAALLALAASSSLLRPLSTLVQLERAGGFHQATSLSLNAMVAEALSALIDFGVGPLGRTSLALAFGAFALALLPVLLFPRLFLAAAGRKKIAGHEKAASHQEGGLN